MVVLKLLNDKKREKYADWYVKLNIILKEKINI